jgi:F-type H+-transporting ATPase subunit b
MIPIIFAAAETEATGIAALGVNLSAFLVQLATFLLLFVLLKRFAFKPIISALDKRQRVISDGVETGKKMAKEFEKLDQEIADKLKSARQEADSIIAEARKEAREITKEADKTAQRKADIMINDAQIRIDEETKAAKKALEDDIFDIVSKSVESIINKKVDVKQDKQIVEDIIKKSSKDTAWSDKK